MKVTLVGAGMLPIPPVDYGAVEKHIWNLAQALEARGHHVRIVNRVFGGSSKDEYRFALWARREVAREAHDVLHLHTPGVATIFQALGPRRFVYTTHSRHWAGVHGLGPHVGHFLEKRAVDAAAETIAVSRFVADQIARPTHVIPNGVDVARYAPPPAPPRARRLVGVGEVAPHKQWHVAAAAAARVGATLQVAGPIRDVAYARDVERLGEGRASLLGPLDEPALVKLLQDADALVHPSVSESFGMAVVEGMSCGLPVVCSDMLSFLVTPDVEGLHIPTRADDAHRIEAAAQALARILGDEKARDRMGAAARARAVRDFSWEGVAARVEDVYRRVVGA